MSEPNDGQDVGENYKTACVRFPRFPLQWLCRQRPAWRGQKAAWLETLKADAPLRYVSAEAESAGLSPGVRYAAALGLVPDLLAGTCELEELALAEKAIVKRLRQFTPDIRRGSDHLGNGLYLLGVGGLDRAFGGMGNWGKKLIAALAGDRWDVVVAIGYTPFACEMATYHLDDRRSLHLFSHREQEQSHTLRTPLSVFGLSPDQVRRLQRFGVILLEDFLALEPEDVRRRFGSDLVEFYAKASEALFTEFAPLVEEDPLVAQMGLPQPISDQMEIVEIARRLINSLLPRLIRREEGVGRLTLWLLTESGQRLRQSLLPSYPTVDSAWLCQLLRLRLESFFVKHPLRWGNRVERVAISLIGEPDPEKQGELFSDWSLVVSGEEEALLPRDREAALWALSRVRAEYGESCLRRAHLVDHPLPGRDYVWASEKESKDWFQAPKGSRAGRALPTGTDSDRRIRRQLARPLPLTPEDRWKDKEGPYLVDGGWWEASYARQYFFARTGSQTGWLYWDEASECWFAQGWLQ